MGICLKKKQTKEKVEYFLYFNKVKSQYFNYIKTNVDNNKIALQKKDFEKIRQVKLKHNDSLKIKDVDWLVYILKYFRKKYREGSKWYKDIINKTHEENFIYEMQYQSYGFYKDFEMKYRPKILRNYENELIDKKEDKEEELVSMISRNTMIDLSRNSRMELSGITDNYGGSFGEFKEDLDSSEDIGVKSKIKLKQFIKVLKRHLNIKDHPINIIISLYCKYFSLYLGNKIDAFIDMKNRKENNFTQEIKSFSDEFIEDLKRFIIKIQTTTKLFYCKAVNLEFFVEEKDELINLITSMIFVKNDIYKNIYSLFEMQFQKEVNDFKYKLYLVKDTKPTDLNIPNKLSLDENTLKEISRLKEEVKKEDENHLFKNKMFIPEDGYIKGFHNKNKIDGYNTVVTMMHGLKHANTPFDKMMLIASMSTEITQCVDTYWNNMDSVLPSYYLSINADEFLSLYILVVIKAQFPELIIHEKIIQYFTTKTTKSSTIGYYNVTLNAAIEYIQNEAPKELKSNSESKRFRNSAHLISKYLYQNSNNKDTDEFVLIDSQGKNINVNNNNNNIINNINPKLSKNTFTKMDFKKIGSNDVLGIGEEDKKKYNNDLNKIIPNLSKNTFTKINCKKKVKNEILGIEEEDEKNFELLIKNSDDEE